MAASVIVNEINTGGSTMPGDWFELVVVGWDGTAGSTVDLRGWTMRVDNDGSTSTFGAPNEWSGGAEIQDFSAFVVPEPSSALLGLAACVRRRR